MRLVILGALLLLAGVAQASPITYKFTGTGDFSVAGTSFVATAFTISALGDTTGISRAGLDFSNDVTAVFAVGANVASFLPITRVGSFFGGLISLSGPGNGTLSGTNLALDGYGLDKAAGPSTLVFPNWSGNFTIGNHLTLNFTNVSGLTFAATPVPATMPLLATSLLGGAGLAFMRRRRVA